MKLKKGIFAIISFLMLTFSSVPAKADLRFYLECIAIDALNFIVTPMPIIDGETGKQTIITAVEATMNDLESLFHLIKYMEKLAKLSINPTSIFSKIKSVKVTSIESVTKGTQTIVDGFKSATSGVVDFEKPETTKRAISATAVVANPVNSVEEIEASERREAFIQQAFIDLHADILVAKKKLADLNEADSQAQEASSTGDSIGNSNVVMVMRNFENQVQALEENLSAMRIALEGIKNLKDADVLKEDVSVGGTK